MRILRISSAASIFVGLFVFGCGAPRNGDEDGDDEENGGGTGQGSGGSAGVGNAGSSGMPADRCASCEAPAECSTGFCNRIARDDFTELVIGETQNTGVCSAPGDTGQCGCFIGFIDGNSLCVGTGCAGTPVELCSHLSGDPYVPSGGAGGVGGAAGSAGAAGASGMSGAGTGGSGGSGSVTCSAPASSAIDDFSGATELAFSYGEGIVLDSSMGALHVSGTLATFGGFGVVFIAPECVDASAYSGISFNVRGNAGSSASLSVQVGTRSNTPVDPAGFGTCAFASETTKYSDCVLPSSSVPVTTTSSNVRLTWADFTGGKPAPGVMPDGVLTLQWNFAYSEVPYAVDVTVDGIAFF